MTRPPLSIFRLEEELARKRKDLEDGELEDGELDDDDPVITHETPGGADRHSTEDMQGKHDLIMELQCLSQSSP